MIAFVALFDQVLQALRFILVVSAGVFAVFCVLDWMVRTRKLNVFGPVARFSRSRIDPILEPVEKRIVRAGGNPASAPLWALAAVVIGGILLLSVLNFIRSEIIGLAFALQSGPGAILPLLVGWTFDFLRIAILVRVVTSWLPISQSSPWVRWAFVVSEPILKPLRAILPAMGPIDISPIIAYFLIGFIQGAVVRMM